MRRSSIALAMLFLGSAALVVLETASVGVVKAQGTAAGLIHACVRNTGEGPNLRIVDPTDACRANEKPLQWGDRSGLAILLRENGQIITVAPGERAVLAVPCREGEAVVGGGLTRVPVSLRFFSSGPFFDGVISGWRVDYTNDGTEPVVEQASVGALCAPGSVTNG